jgi:CheY-like chemotaxis protein
VALTGYGQSQDRKEAEQAGFDHYLVKPADMDQVNAVLAEAARGAGH